ncbi:MAG: hypothetical protein AAF446_09770 [Pseudomonadota bacterium]
MQEDLEPATPTDHSGVGINGLSLIAIGISIAALLISVMEVLAVKDEQRAQVWPYLEVSESYSADGFQLYLSNKGVGPARVRSAVMRLDGEVITDLNAAILETLGEADAFGYDLYRSSDPAPGVMSPDERIVLFGVPWEERTRKLTQAWSGRVGIEVCYCSVYDDCWMARLGNSDPDVVRECSAPDA